MSDLSAVVNRYIVALSEVGVAACVAQRHAMSRESRAVLTLSYGVDTVGSLVVENHGTTHDVTILGRKVVGEREKTVASLTSIGSTAAMIDNHSVPMVREWAVGSRLGAAMVEADRRKAREVVSEDAGRLIADYVMEDLKANFLGFEPAHHVAVAEHVEKLRPLMKLVDALGYGFPQEAEIDHFHELLDRRLVAAQAVKGARSDLQIVGQTEKLARLTLSYISTGYTAPDDFLFHEATDGRGVTAWNAACRIQEILTGTDPTDALSALEDDGEDGPDFATRLAEAADSIEGMDLGRTEEQIVDQTEEVARVFLSIQGTQGYAPLDGVLLRNSDHPRAQKAWQGACAAQELVTFTDPHDAVLAYNEDPEEAEEVTAKPAPSI